MLSNQVNVNFEDQANVFIVYIRRSYYYYDGDIKERKHSKEML
jgi:hypothetical protein